MSMTTGKSSLEFIQTTSAQRTQHRKYIQYLQFEIQMCSLAYHYKLVNAVVFPNFSFSFGRKGTFSPVTFISGP